MNEMKKTFEVKSVLTVVYKTNCKKLALFYKFSIIAWNYKASKLDMKTILVMLGTILAIYFFSIIIASLLHLYVMAFLKLVLCKETKLSQKRKGLYILIIILLVQNLETKDILQKGTNLHRFNSLYNPKLAIHDLDIMVLNPQKNWRLFDVEKAQKL